MSELGSSAAQVSLFGEVLVDVFAQRETSGGAPYNVARHLKGLGLEPLLISRVGRDARAESLLDTMRSQGLLTEGIQHDPSHPTGSVLVEQDPHGHRFVIPEQQAYDYIHPRMTHLTCLGTSPALAYFGTLSQRNTQSRLALDVFLQESACPHFLDLNLREPWISRPLIDRSMKRAQIVKMSAEELALASNLLGMGSADPQAAAIALIKDYALESCIVTDGARGAWMVQANHRIHHVCGLPLEGMLIDTVGAGDAFSAMCIFGILRDWEPLVMLEKANEFAAAICTIQGAVPEGDAFYQPYRNQNLIWD